ncbi:HAD-IC family P-type ATPase [Lapidilactobacillus wuchangensis]|uniref:HAD-IC family P-type ATPase n=1 Tax=Lapidilactobacillus wuchangensis TaxID=2486001 RepID=UPI000F78D10C|nr:HAD-IC family P-type ATPase [Lapidilactobacillus wuchangensis]
MHQSVESKEPDGLTTTAVTKQFQKDGPNEVAEPAFNFRHAIIRRLWEPSAWILEAALILELILGKQIQASFILLLLLFAAVDGAIQERRASTVLHSLSHQLTPTVAVKRDHQWQKLPAPELVIGDLISLKRGDIIPADVQLLNQNLEIDESSITGEAKAVTHQPGETAFAGTTVLNGDGLATVTATGQHSRSGKTISLINHSRRQGHLQILLGKIISCLAILDSILAVILIIASLIRGENIIEMLPFLAMLFIATIPIAMPSSFAVANSVEANVLSKQQILVSDLVGIQEAANLNLLLVDKTGTITTNKSTVLAFHNFSNYADRVLLQAALSATDQRHQSVVDRAIIQYGQKQHQVALPTVKFVPFDASVGYSESHLNVDQQTLDVKLGSFKRLSALAKTPIKLPAQIDLRQGRSVAMLINDEFAGLFLLQDPPRADSAAAIQEIQRRGVKVIMLTGDNQQTAAALAPNVGLAGKVISFNGLASLANLQEISGIADVVPEDKLAIVKEFQKQGDIIGMTGDGVNDAPALKQADVGIAVENAVDLAKRSASMVLLTAGLQPVIEILDSGHRVYQRMMTWTITKLARTAELTMLLVFGYLFLGYIPLTLNAMVLVAILNDLVTLVLGTDNTTITYQPEKWRLAQLSKSASILAVGWTAVGFGILFWLHNQGLPMGQVSTALYCYLIFSAMLTIFMTRTKKFFWQSKPSNAVIAATTTNIVLSIILALTGWGVTAISFFLLLEVMGLTLATALVLALLQKAWQQN